MTQLLHERAPDEARGSRDQDSHRGRVYCRASVLLAAGLLVSGCHGTRHPAPPPPKPRPVHKLSFRALDAEQQRFVGHYEPVSRALTGYELAYRAWGLGQLRASGLASRARSFAQIVDGSLARVRTDPATGADAPAKALLVRALEARSRALALPPTSASYRREWNLSVVDARRALTMLQDIRDRARLIPLPEDAVS